MSVPSPFQSSITLFQYLIFAGVLYTGIFQLIRARQGLLHKLISPVSLGAICLIMGFIGMFQKMKEAFLAIEAAGDISPQIVAHSISEIYDYPIFGLFTLGIAFAFKFVLQLKI